MELDSKKFRAYIDEGEIISNNIDDSKLRIDCNNFIMRHSNNILNNEENGSNKSIENRRNIIIIDPIRILGEQPVPLKEIEKINNLTMKPKKQVPRILLSPRQIYSPEYNSHPILDLPELLATSQSSQKKKKKKKKKS